ELLNLGAIYPGGRRLWRVPLSTLGTWSLSWPYGPPDGAQPPRKSLEPQFGLSAPANHACLGTSCDVGCDAATRDLIALQGTGLSLVHQRRRDDARARNHSVEIPL